MADGSTEALLLDALRVATASPDLQLAGPPSELTGGFYAEMLRFRVVDPPADLEGDLVARIVPHAAAGAWEATIQREVARQGFLTPSVRLTLDESGPLGRYLIVMDAVDGQPPMAGLSFGSIATQIPTLVRHLPDQLAHIAAALHGLDPEPLAAQLAALPDPLPLTTAGFVEQQAGNAVALGRRDIAAAADRLLASEPRARSRVITHGDLHPFNLLLAERGPTLIDWTVAGIADPGFTLGFTDLMLANPPVPLPRAGKAMLAPLGRNIARRFVRTYRRLTDGTAAEVGEDSLEWHRKVHALRILVELAGWRANGTLPSTGHPWLALEPVASSLLAISP